MLLNVQNKQRGYDMKNKEQKEIVETLFIFIVFTTISILVGIINTSINYDVIWCFHMIQKVANGYMLYSEVNTVVTPIFFWIGSLFIKIFGNSLVSFAIYGGVIWGVLTTTLYKIVKKIMIKENRFAIILFMIIAIQLTPSFFLANYNITAAMWIFIALLIEIKNCDEKKKINDYLIGIFLALAFFTKQNIGTFGVLATGAISLINELVVNKKNPIKEIIRKATGFLSMLAIFCGYFVLTNTFNDFILFCFGGLVEFGSNNFSISLSGNTFIMLVIAMISGFYIKESKNKDKKILVLFIYYLLMCLIMFPLMNAYHTLLSMLFMIPVVIYLLNLITIEKKVYNLFVAVIGLLWFSAQYLFESSVMSDTELFFNSATEMSNLFFILLIICNLLLLITTVLSICVSGIKSDKNMNIKTPMYFIITICLVSCIVITKINLDNSKDIETPGIGIYKSHGYEEEKITYIKDVIEYILEKEKEGYKVYVVSADASYYMAELNRNQYKYDMVLYGSLGHNGEDTLIEETSKLNDAIILKDKNLMWQEPKKFDQYIKENYKAIDEIRNLIVYIQNDK